jgi:hypothetical protein
VCGQQSKSHPAWLEGGGSIGIARLVVVVVVVIVIVVFVVVVIVVVVVVVFFAVVYAINGRVE